MKENEFKVGDRVIAGVDIKGYEWGAFKCRDIPKNTIGTMIKPYTALHDEYGWSHSVHFDGEPGPQGVGGQIRKLSLLELIAWAAL